MGETTIDYRVEVWLDNGRCWEPVGNAMFLELGHAIDYLHTCGIFGWRYRIVRVERTIVHGTEIVE